MSAIKQFWSFKQILRGAEQDEEFYDDQDHANNPPSFSKPFLANQAAGQPKMLSELHQWLEVSPTESNLKQKEASDEDFRSGEVKQKLVMPTSEDLEALNVTELRRLRRHLALQFHPDRLLGESGEGIDGAMMRCNQMIDEAIAQRVKLKRN